MSSALLERVAPSDEQEPGFAGSGGLIEGQRLPAVLAAFAQVADAAQHSGRLDDLLHVVARQLCELVGVGRCSIHLRDEREGLFRGCVCYAGRPSDKLAIKRSRAGVPADGVTRELLSTGRPVIVSNAADDPRTIKATVRFWGIQSIMAVPMVVHGDIVGVVFLDDDGRPHAFSAEDAAIASVFGDLAAVVVVKAQLETELRGQIEAAARHIRALRRATAVDDRLSSLVLDGRSLQELLDNLAELVAKPCAVFDTAGNRLAVATLDADDNAIFPHLLEPEYATRAEVRDALDAHRDSKAFVIGPFPRAGILHRHVVAPIVVGGAVWGHLVVMEHKSRFVGGDMLTVQRAGTLVALQMNAMRQAVEADGGAGASLIAELLSAGTGLEAVHQRADKLGIGLTEPRVVMVLGARDARSTNPDHRVVRETLTRLAPALEVHAAAIGTHVAILVRVPEDVESATFVARCKRLLGDLCASLASEGELIAAASAPRGDAEGYRTAYAEAVQTVECIRRFSPSDGPSVFSVDDLGAGRLFLATSDRDLIADDAEAAVGVLVADPATADLLVTLRSFFDNRASIRRCAACLGVHENTIRYRLARIEDLTGLAVTHDPDAQLRVRLALLVLLLQGRLLARAENGGVGAAAG